MPAQKGLATITPTLNLVTPGGLDGTQPPQTRLAADVVLEFRGGMAPGRLSSSLNIRLRYYSFQNSCGGSGTNSGRDDCIIGPTPCLDGKWPSEWVISLVMRTFSAFGRSQLHIHPNLAST